jgi:glycosyltransferase involved in cell wall biosynthesis
MADTMRHETTPEQPPMTNAPTVSVVIPCYNHGIYLQDALNSVLAQSYTDVEIIVVDDGSTDTDSLAALMALEPQITQVIRTGNHGVIHARNTGIAAARGRYILPLDADDKIGERYLELAVAQLEANATLGIVYCNAELFGEQTGPWELPPYRFPDILIGNVIFNAGLFKRADWEAVGGYNPNMRDGWEDYDFWIALIERGCQVHQLAETLFYYRINPQSRNNAMQANSSRYAKAYTQIFRNHHALYIQHIDVVFNELVRLWDVIADKQQQLTASQQAMATLQAQLTARDNTLLGKLQRHFAPTDTLNKSL